jgi:cytochrome bd-type quinol oxidase subunit 2
MHPLLGLLATRPQLLVDHAQAYAALFSEELDQACATWQRRAVLQAVALCCLGVAAVLAGVALMLWAVNPVPQTYAPWVLLFTPLLPLLVAAACLVLVRKSNCEHAFANLSRQISADIAMLRTLNSP